MAFKKKTWSKRLVEYPNRRKLIKTDGSTETVTVERLEGTVSQEGDAFSEENMNDLEQRIEDEFTELNSNMEWKKLDGGNLYVMYNDIAVLVRANKTGITLASQTKDTTIFTMPSTIKPNIDIFIPCSVLNSSYVQTTINANIILTANHVQLSSGGMLNNNVITFDAMFPRNWFDITE